jgi:sporulation protein YlmC with PRC-barrel domain
LALAGIDLAIALSMTLRLALFALAAAFMTAALAQTERPAVTPGELMGERVVGREGELIGEIAGIRLDVRDNGVHYIELQREAQSFAYPVNALHRADGILRLNVPAERLDGLPGNPLPIARYVPAQRVIGGGVDDALGNRAGVLVDLGIDPQSGRTIYYLVEFEPSGERLKLPAHNLRLQPHGNPVLRASQTRRG